LQSAQLDSEYEELINLINQALQHRITRQIRRDLVKFIIINYFLKWVILSNRVATFEE